jgi:DNA polymerase-3 subunit epsilon
MLKYFNTQWDEVPIVVVDTETTGKRPGVDRTVSFGLARFERGVFVGGLNQLVRCGLPIPAEATAIHGITNDHCAGKPFIEDLFADGCVDGSDGVAALLREAQPAAYNAPFDRYFVPPFGDDWTWPWLDALSLVRKVDRFAKGAGRHKLAMACGRHGVALPDAHNAGADARACGELLFKIGRELFPKQYTLGEALGWCRRAEAEEWFRFNEWLSRQPPREAVSA